MVEQVIDINIEKVHPSWVEFLRDFPSRASYEKRINDFLDWQKDIDGNSLDDKLILYFKMKHEEETAPTTLRSWLSMFTKFWLHSGRGDLKAKLPIIEDSISKWEKTHTVKKSKTFTKEDLGK